MGSANLLTLPSFNCPLIEGGGKGVQNIAFRPRIDVGDQAIVAKETDSSFVSRTAKQPSARLRRCLAGAAGQAVVEFAFVVPIFLFLLGGLIEVADAFNSYITVVDVSRDGARLGSKGLASDTDIQNMVATEMGRLRDTFNKTTDTTITHNQITGDAAIQVKVCSNHHLLLGSLTTAFINSPLRICATTSMRTLTYQ